MLSHVENCCGVCGRHGARLNYNGLTCSSCRVFFYRCVKGREPDPCASNGKCIITNRKRGNCGFCRFKRCCELNMETNKVGLRRQFSDLKVPKLSTTIVDFCMTQFHSSLYWRTAVVVPSSIETILTCHKLSINEGAASPSFTVCNMNVSLEELLSTPASCASRDTACFDVPARELDENVKYSLPISFCRWAVSYADLYQSTHYFSLLTPEDQLKLAQYNFLDFVTLSILEGYLKSNIPAREVVTLCQRFSISMVRNPTTVRASDVFRRFEGGVAHPLYREHNFDDVEYTAMKILAMFAPPVTLSEDGIKKVNFVREQYTFKLAEHIADQHNQLPRPAQLVRLKLLLKIVREVKDVSQLWEYFLTDATVNKQNEMSGQLFYDMHVRKF